MEGVRYPDRLWKALREASVLQYKGNMDLLVFKDSNKTTTATSERYHILLMVRDCYHKLAKQVHGHFTSSDIASLFIILRNPGIGMSFFL